MGIVRNVGRTDRIVRTVLAICLGVAGILSKHEIAGRLLGIAGALLILSASFGT